MKLRTFISKISGKLKEQRELVNLPSSFAKGWRAGATLLAVLTLTATALENWTTLQQWRVSHFGEDDATLVVRRARLIPYFSKFPGVADRDQFSLQLELRNYGESAVMLTSADIEIVDAKGAKIGPGGSAPADGGCVLSPVPDDHQPIELRPGESVWFEVSPMVNLPGIHRWLDRIQKEGAHVMPGDFLAIRDLKIVDELNAELARKFGSDAKILVTLFTGIRERRRTLTFFLARGKDLFARDGSLMHDALISFWLSPNAKAIALNCRKAKLTPAP